MLNFPIKLTNKNCKFVNRITYYFSKFELFVIKLIYLATPGLAQRHYVPGKCLKALVSKWQHVSHHVGTEVALMFVVNYCKSQGGSNGFASLPRYMQYFEFQV